MLTNLKTAGKHQDFLEDRMQPKIKKKREHTLNATAVTE